MKTKKVIVFTLLAVLLVSTMACGGGEEARIRFIDLEIERYVVEDCVLKGTVRNDNYGRHTAHRVKVYATFKRAEQKDQVTTGKIHTSTKSDSVGTLEPGESATFGITVPPDFCEDVYSTFELWVECD